MHPDKLLTPETWARAKAHFEKVLESVQAGLPADTPSFEIEITRKNGTRVWLDTTYSLVYDQGGNVVAIQGSNRDISERKKAQQELQSREEQYRILAENISDSVWVMDPHAFKFKYVSPSSEAMAGYTAEEILAMHPDQLLTPETWAKAKANFERVLQASQAGLSVETPPFEIEIIRKDGTSGWGETTYSLIYDEGNIVAIQGSNRDITERKKAQQELQESEGKYRNIFENAPFGIFHATLTGKLVDVNPMMARTFGYASPDDLIAASSADLESLVHGEPDSRPTLLKDVLPASGWCKYEKPFRCKDGRIITANLALRRIPYPTKSGAELEGFVEDITDLKLYQEQLKEKLNEIKKLKEQFEKDNVFLREEVKLLFEHNDIVGESSALNRVLVKAEQVAPTDSIVLIHGETGTGKELLARAIHNLSKRKDRTLITVNCASLPPSLIESELFGHEKGAYTGALTKMIGRFETADGSSLFLDEIGELPYELQGKLLRVIELGRFERLGSAKTIQVDVRLIAATNRDLAQDVKEGKFRKDLFYRLNVFPIELPPLRERVEDIPALVWAFVGQFEKKLGKRIESISQKDIEALKRYSWPGNIRELKNVIEHAMIVSGKTLHLRPPMTPVQDSSELYTLEEYERRYILRVLERTHWRISGKNGAAKMLGVKRTTLHSMLKKLGITRPD
jgi:PAS domain S-box-containing protein